MPLRSVPGSASIAQTDPSGRMFAPAAARNQEALLAQLVRLAPAAGLALELASGTGQHVVAFAEAIPDLQWQPSEVDPDRLRSIQAYVTASARTNVLDAIALDASQSGWSATVPPQDLIVVVNLLHLMSNTEVADLLNEAAQALRAGGRFMIYGPFRRQGRLTSDGDRQFDTGLRTHDPEIGYKDDVAIRALLQACKLQMLDIIEMPANNLLLVAERTP